MKKIKMSKRQAVAAGVVAAAVLAAGGGGFAVGHHAAPTSDTVPHAYNPHRWMRVDVTPPDDPYDLIHGRWPAISEGAVDVLADTVLGWIMLPPRVAPTVADTRTAVPTAGQVVRDYVTVAGPDMLRQLRVDPAAILVTGDSAGRLSGFTAMVADRVVDTKYMLAGIVADGTEKADAAMPGPELEAVIADCRARVVAEVAKLDAWRDRLGRKISTPIEGTSPEGTGVTVFGVPQPDGTDLYVNRDGFELNRDGKIVGDHPIVSMPPSPPAQHTGYEPTR